MERIDLGSDRRASSDRRAMRRHGEAAALVAALDRDEIEILFQPQFAAVDGALVGAEALARWQHPEHVLIGGEALFATAQRVGLVGRLSRHVAAAALAAAVQWRDDLRLSLNVTAADLAE